MRRNNADRMTVVEQVVKIKDDICQYVCKYKEMVEEEYSDYVLRCAKLQGYCHNCPVEKLNHKSRVR